MVQRALQRNSARSAALILVFAVWSSSCVRPVPRPASQPNGINLNELWEDPLDIANRDLFHGPGGASLTPDDSAQFTFVKADLSGYSKGYDVSSPDGATWNVKLGPEAQSEVAASRLLWAIGYHQPPTYYVPRWTLVGEQTGPQAEGRFRLESPDRKVVGEWSWYENEFVATQPFRGLVVANLMINNWDWKTSNNKIVEADGGQGVRRQFVVRDVGASLGKTTFPSWLKWLPIRGFGQGTRNDIDGFESQGFIQSTKGEQVEFDYKGIHRPVLKVLTVADVVWTSRLMARVSEQQLHDAFRAAGYSPEHAGRYVRKLKAKIAEGLALES